MSEPRQRTVAKQRHVVSHSFTRHTHGNREPINLTAHRRDSLTHTHTHIHTHTNTRTHTHTHTHIHTDTHTYTYTHTHTKHTHTYTHTHTHTESQSPSISNSLSTWFTDMDLMRSDYCEGGKLPAVQVLKVLPISSPPSIPLIVSVCWTYLQVGKR